MVRKSLIYYCSYTNSNSLKTYGFRCCEKVFGYFLDKTGTEPLQFSSGQLPQIYWLGFGSQFLRTFWNDSVTGFLENQTNPDRVHP